MIHTYLHRPQPPCLGHDKFGLGSMCPHAVNKVARTDGALQSSLPSVMEIRPRLPLHRIGVDANRRAGLLPLPRELDATEASSLWSYCCADARSAYERCTGLWKARDVAASSSSQPQLLGRRRLTMSWRRGSAPQAHRYDGDAQFGSPTVRVECSTDWRCRTHGMSLAMCSAHRVREILSPWQVTVMR